MLRVALDRRGHAPADGLDELRRQVARDGEEAGALVRIQHRQLAALQRVALVGHRLAHHLDHVDVVARQQQPLLAVGREAHVAGRERQRVRGGDGLLAQALHVERDLLLPLRDQHARVVGACLHHRAQAVAQALDADLRRPGPDRAALVVEHAHQRVGQVGGVGGRHVDRRPPRRAGRRQVQVREVGARCPAARSARARAVEGSLGSFAILPVSARSPPEPVRSLHPRAALRQRPARVGAARHQCEHIDCGARMSRQHEVHPAPRRDIACCVKA